MLDASEMLGGNDPNIFDMGAKKCFEVETIFPRRSFLANFIRNICFLCKWIKPRDA